MRTAKVLLAVVLCLVLFSCTKESFDVTQTIALPFVRTDGTMGLSLYVLPQSTTDKGSVSSAQMTVRSPEGNLSWSFEAKRVKHDGLQYFGSSDIFMPEGLELPKGKWSAEVIFQESNTVDLTFDVSFTDVASALDRFRESGSEAPWFDEKSNLTVID